MLTYIKFAILALTTITILSVRELIPDRPAAQPLIHQLVING